jgi:tetratricopeptide (TPR) repeat protein
VFSEAEGLPGLAARSLGGLGRVARQSGEFELAAERFERALDAWKDTGNRLMLAVSLNSAGDAWRLLGQLDRAEGRFREALALVDRVGAPISVVINGNLSALMAVRGEYQESLELIEGVVRDYERQGRRELLGGAHAGFLHPLAGLGDWAGFDRHLRRARALVKATQLAERDIVFCAQLAADLALAAGEQRRAGGALRLALDQARRLGSDGDVAEIEAKLAAIDPP